MVRALGFEGVSVAGTTAERPSVAPEGQFFFDATIGEWLVWDDSQGANGGWRIACGLVCKEILFTETTGAGVYTGEVELPAGATLHDIIINGIALWTATTSAAMIVGDDTDPNGYFDAIDLKATDLLAGESLSFALAGGQAGAYIANSQVSPRYSAVARSIIGEITTVGAAGNAGRTRMTVVYSAPRVVDATKVAS